MTNNVDTNEKACYESSHLYLQCLHIYFCVCLQGCKD